MGTAQFDNRRILLLQAGQGADQLFNRRIQLVFYVEYAGNVHGSRECIIGALALVHVVVGMDAAVDKLVAPVRQHFVDVHIGLRAASGLPYGQRKLIVPLTFKHFISRQKDALCHSLVQQTDFMV